MSKEVIIGGGKLFFDRDFGKESFPRRCDGAYRIDRRREAHRTVL